MSARTKNSQIGLGGLAEATGTKPAITAGTCKDAAAWLDEPDEPTNPLVEDLIEVGSVIAIVGPAKAAKSWLAEQFAVCIATGTDFLGRKVKRQRVYYANVEISERQFKKRLRSICKRLEVNPEKLRGQLFVDNLRGHTATWELCLECARMHASELVVIDPFYQVFKGKETDETDCQAAVEEMKKFISDGSTLAVVFHAPKGYAGDRQIVDMISGSAVLVRYPENVVAILPHATEKTARVVDCSILRDYPPPDPFTVKLDGGALIPAPDISPELRGTRCNRPAKTQEERDAEKVDRENKRDEQMRTCLMAFLKERGKDIPSSSAIFQKLRRTYPKHAVEDFIKECKEDGTLVAQDELTRDEQHNLVAKSRRGRPCVLLSTPEWVEAYRGEWGAPADE